MSLGGQSIVHNSDVFAYTGGTEVTTRVRFWWILGHLLISLSLSPLSYPWTVAKILAAFQSHCANFPPFNFSHCEVVLRHWTSRTFEMATWVASENCSAGKQP